MRLAEKEFQHLEPTRSPLFQGNTINEHWVNGLEAGDARQDTLEAFTPRFARLQDTLGDKLLPRFFLLTGEKPGTFLDNLNRAERLGLIDSAAERLPLRTLRNKLIHDYMENARYFAESLNLANRSIDSLKEVYRRIVDYVRDVLSIDQAKLAST